VNKNNSIIKFEGIIKFDPQDVTNKHKKQSSWKKVAMIYLEKPGTKKGICEYYAWFLKKRYNLNLQKPLRGAHITFINDRVEDIKGDWEFVKKKWNNKKIDIYLNVEPRTDSAESKGRTTYNWWINIPKNKRNEIQEIRNELGLGIPFFGLHMTIGRAVNIKDDSLYEMNAEKATQMNVEHSIYIHNLFLKEYIK
jgi:hypothetical protein